MTAHKLRPYLPSDADDLHEIFVISILELAEDDYEDEQREAWAASAGDPEEFGERLAAMVTLLVVEDGVPIGFAALKDKTILEMLYVHPEHAREGVATALVDALEKLAASWGTTEITVEASDTALPFLLDRGYQPRERQTVTLGDVWISNTRMTKPLGPAPAKD